MSSDEVSKSTSSQDISGKAKSFDLSQMKNDFEKDSSFKEAGVSQRKVPARSSVPDISKTGPSSPSISLTNTNAIAGIGNDTITLNRNVSIRGKQGPDPSDDSSETSQALYGNELIPSSYLEQGQSTSPNAGGEWEILTSKVSTWWNTNHFSINFSELIRPVALVAGLIIFLAISGSILGALSKIPLAPRLCELVGIIWLTRFSVTSLVRSADRQELLLNLQKGWEKFSGSSNEIL